MEPKPVSSTWSLTCVRSQVTTTYEYDITHADGSKTLRTVVDKDGDETVTEKKVPAPANYTPPKPEKPIGPPRDCPAGAGWKASRNVEARGGAASSTRAEDSTKRGCRSPRPKLYVELPLDGASSARAEAMAFASSRLARDAAPATLAPRR